MFSLLRPRGEILHRLDETTPLKCVKLNPSPKSFTLATSETVVLKNLFDLNGNAICKHI